MCGGAVFELWECLKVVGEYGGIGWEVWVEDEV